MTDWPVDDRKFPGVSIMSLPRPDDRGLEFRANFAATALVVVPDADVAVAAEKGYAELGRRAEWSAKLAAHLVMRTVALIVLRLVRRDWTGFFEIHMEIVDRRQFLVGDGEKRGRVTKVDRAGRVLTVAWNFNLDGPKEEQIAFDEALDKFQRRDWDLP